jgi:hypothetical protein
VSADKRLHRIKVAIGALAFAGALTVGVSGAASATPDRESFGAFPIVIWFLTSEADAPTDPDIEARPDDEWTSECDDDGNCESVPGFMDPGPGAPGGPNGPRW